LEDVGPKNNAGAALSQPTPSDIRHCQAWNKICRRTVGLASSINSRLNSVAIVQPGESVAKQSSYLSNEPREQSRLFTNVENRNDVLMHEISRITKELLKKSGHQPQASRRTKEV
jgi:hypothetical protein